MNHRILILGFVLWLTFSGCKYENINPQHDVPQSTIDYLIFGTASFCLNCDAIYKIENGKLYGANHRMISDPDVVQLSAFSNASYEKVSSLTSEIPSQLTIGSTTTVQTIGSYFPDVGHYYIEVSQNHKVHRWYIEAGNRPDYLNSFLEEVSNAMAKLN